jgi:uncharacterized protein (TIGR04255 family)
MPFPDSPRVFYGKNPLEEVVCQLRFPPILRVEAESPVAFQEKIRSRFPLYQRSATGLPALPLSLPIPVNLMQAFAGITQPQHEFLTPDGAWKLTLHRDFIALTTSTYTRWEGFRTYFQEPLAALREIYQPAFFQRVGLRYRDRIDRPKLGLADVPWRELLRTEVLGELGDPVISPHIEHILRELTIKLADDLGRVRVVHGLDPGTQQYVIDSDFYAEGQLDPGAVSNVMDSFNKRSARFFRWCIHPKLHDAMDPRPPP